MCRVPVAKTTVFLKVGGQVPDVQVRVHLEGVPLKMKKDASQSLLICLRRSWAIRL